ncbi:ribonuclease HII [Chelatococcus reniformis]|nr:ribonuclease HII [Chelatococcus reniformis]
MARRPTTDSLPMELPEGPTFDRERRLRRRGLWPVAGLDEVGRGPLAGPVVAAAVVLDPADIPAGLNDSKALDGETRETLYPLIMAKALVGVACVSAREIDATDIRKASLAAMSRALASLPVAARFALVDGRDRPAVPCEVEAIIRGDALVASIAAASIVAKVVRDRLMRRLCQHYPVYGFSRHVGYATVEHRRAIAQHGPCPYHRLSFAPFRLAEARAEAVADELTL